ncbi:MAG: 5-(carboxyamino)imidazole ribonucleotide mutase [Deltaproteobacteria bacterium RIFCSPLOWO2_02_FULL_46_8]|nr:MAG: 5-(carboxyamino)imidazole ribonucleotide mutase [Deltaproteobacteria bacterium RIFCSPLOWO2_02_FULL_46_8]
MFKKSKIKVGVIMGSDSDLPILKETVRVLRRLKIGFEVKILSAHRTPQKTLDYAKKAKARGIQIIIAGAGGAAHLAGVIAALTPLPVIGVPIPTRALHGMDSLLSMVQMPSGIPVATVAIGAGTNAGLLAAQILALSDKRLALAMEHHKKTLMRQTIAKNKKLKY